MSRRRMLVVPLLVAGLSFPSLAQLAVRGETVYTMAGPPINDGVVLMKGGLIEKVGPASSIVVPAGYRLVTGKVVTPGLVDAHSVVGLAGILNYGHDRMELERSEAVQPELRAIDAYNPLEELVAYVRSFGVTTLHTGHAPGALASGTTIVVKTTGNTVNEALIDSVGMVAFTLGESVQDNFKTPGTSAKAVAMIRAELVKAQDYVKRRAVRDTEKRPPRDLRMEMLAAVLAGERKVIFTAHRATSIMAALRLQKEFGFRMVLDGAAEAPLLLREIRSAGVPVILHPTMERPYGDMRSVSLETAAALQKEGILFAIQSGYEGYVPRTRVILFEAAIAAGNGLSFDQALAAITINASRIIGMEKHVGSLEAGKDGDAVVFDGDPFEYTSHVCTVVVNGVVMDNRCR